MDCCDQGKCRVVHGVPYDGPYVCAGVYTENNTQPYTLSLEDDLAVFLVPASLSNIPPIPYGHDWPDTDTWLDPATRTIHTRP